MFGLGVGVFTSLTPQLTPIDPPSRPLTKCMNPAAVSHVLMKMEHRFTSLMELLGRIRTIKLSQRDPDQGLQKENEMGQLIYGGCESIIDNRTGTGATLTTPGLECTRLSKPGMSGIGL